MGPEGSALKNKPSEYRETTPRNEGDLSAIRGQIKSKINQSRKNVANRSVFDSVNNSMMAASQHGVIQSFIEPGHAQGLLTTEPRDINVNLNEIGLPRPKKP